MSIPAFHEIQFPNDIAQGAVGGPMFNTTIEPSTSGFEQSNINWDDARRRWDIGHEITSQDKLARLQAFWLARAGKGYGFRFKDWSDYTVGMAFTGFLPSLQYTSMQQFATGDAATTVFQLNKVYADTINPVTRTINKPVVGTVEIWQSYSGGAFIGPFTASTHNVSTINTWSQNCPLGTGALIVNVSINNVSPTLITSATYGGVAMSGFTPVSNTGVTVKQFYLTAPPIGVNPVVVTFSSSCSGVCQSVAILAASGAVVGLATTNGSGGTASLGVASATHSIVIDCFSTTSLSGGIVSAQTSIEGELESGSGLWAQMSEAPGASSVTIGYSGGTFGNWVLSAVSVTGSFPAATIYQPTDWTVDATTGLVTFGAAPASGSAIYWAGQFDVPARFDTDTMSVNMRTILSGLWASVPIIELRV